MAPRFFLNVTKRMPASKSSMTGLAGQHMYLVGGLTLSDTSTSAFGDQLPNERGHVSAIRKSKCQPSKKTPTRQSQGKPKEGINMTN